MTQRHRKFRSPALKQILCAFFVVLVGLASPSSAQSRAEIEQQFQLWLQKDVWPRARAKGVSKRTFNSAFSGVTLDWKLPDLVPPGTSRTSPKEQTQAEFGAPRRYFARGSLNAASSTGRQMAQKHAGTLAAAEKQTGVPGRIILGIWARESGFGRAKIPHNVFKVLGTKGFMSTRASYFTDELVAALEIAQAGHSGNAQLKSSWAGALGQPQFMPSSFLDYAIDGDGDARADIWNSSADTIYSIANYLMRHGWIEGRDWGFEVFVPPAVSCALEGPDQGRKISAWEKLGIQRVSGRPFPEHERREVGYLLMPAGRSGPAFIVTPNFYVLKAYNTSDLYALFVGHVGDRIAFGSPDFAGTWDDIGTLYRSDIAEIQSALVKQGHDVGGVDGLPGFKTRRSIGRWQERTGQAATCFPTAGMKLKI